MTYRFSRSTLAVYVEGIHGDIPPDAVAISPGEFQALIEGRSAGLSVEVDMTGKPVLVTPPPSPPQEILAAARASARIDRGPLCKALLAAGILSPASAVVAAKGDWPVEFEGVLEAMAPTTRIEAQIDWADAGVVRYGNPLLQQVALAWCDDDEAAAVALLDHLFGLD